MSYRLFLDDERMPVGGDWVIVRTTEAAKIVVAERGLPDFISFDHDLGPGDTGFDFAQWLVDYILDHGAIDPASLQYYVHSQNPVGAERIRGLLDGFKHYLEGVRNVGDDEAAQGRSP